MSCRQALMACSERVAADARDRHGTDGIGRRQDPEPGTPDRAAAGAAQGAQRRNLADADGTGCPRGTGARARHGPGASPQRC